MNAAPTTNPINRQALYFLSGATQLFGWHHTSKTATKRNCVAIICAPIGYEYTHSHRSLRHLCDQLANSGIPAFRFDYHGTGDSPGGDQDGDRITQWLSDIAAAVQFAKSTHPGAQCCVIGVRLGATLAAMAATSTDIDFLVLWNPINSGKRYVRELKTIAATTEDNLGNENSQLLEGGGFLISAQTESALKSIDLLSQTIAVRNKALIVTRDDLAEDASLRDALLATGIDVEQCALAGYSDMMARLEINLVPHAAIRHIVAWIGGQTALRQEGSESRVDHSAIKSTISFVEEDTVLSETCCRFGEADHLFGVLTHGKDHEQPKPTVVFLNSGSVHHVGPGRLYVNLARHLARHGFDCFRIDIEGIGDSVLRGAGKENYPYPDTAISDTEAALQYLQATRNISEFALLGLCSGAYTAFHAGVQLPDSANIKHIVSINPLTFHWIEGETLLTTQAFKQDLWAVNHYKSSALSLERWKKLLSGKADLTFIVQMVIKQFWKKCVAFMHALPEILTMRPQKKLGREIQTLLKAKRSLSFFIASGDPGYELLIRDGGHFAKRLVQTRRISVKSIAKSDHTFSRLTPKTHLIQAVTENLSQRFGI